MARTAELVDGRIDQHLKDDPFTRVPLREEDIGGQLLSILSKGLYTYPLHAIREYVQNAIDAKATTVTIKITGNSAIIHDDGHGMDKAELLAARRFGVSAKSIEWNVGFRGIGIYSGFDLCNRLLITTKKAGEQKAYVLVFDFGEMKRRLGATDPAGNLATIPLAKLLYECSYFREEDEAEGRHYTIVHLEEISPVHLRQLDNRGELRTYILRNLPIDFTEDFPHRDVINGRLREEIPGFHAIRVILESDDQPSEVVQRPTIPDLGAPVMEPIRNGDGKKIAFYWASLRKPVDGDARRGKIPFVYEDYRGFTYKVKGFTIGDNRRLQREFGKGNAALYWWYTGEIYVTDPEVVPNTARNDFETNPAQLALELAVGRALKGLEADAGAYQEQSRAMQVFKDCAASIEELEQDINANAYSALPAYSKLDGASRALKAQKGRLPGHQKQWGQEIIKKAERLMAVVARAIDHPQPATQQRKEATRRRAVGDASAQRSETATAQPAEPSETLAQVIERAGWELSPDCAPLIEVIDRSLAGVLSGTSEVYRSVLANVEAELARDLAE